MTPYKKTMMYYFHKNCIVYFIYCELVSCYWMYVYENAENCSGNGSINGINDKRALDS